MASFAAHVLRQVGDEVEVVVLRFIVADIEVLSEGTLLILKSIKS